MVELVVQQVLQAVITGVVILGVAFSPLGRAIAHRIQYGKPPRQLEGYSDPRVEDLSGEVVALREQLEATQERMDFAERLLAQAREKGQLGAPSDGRA